MVQLRTKRMEVPANCPICNVEDESIIHALVACPAAKLCWDRVGIGTLVQSNSSFYGLVRGQFSGGTKLFNGSATAEYVEALGVKEAFKKD
uniref:Reverse transcriptase zinc-binding domain-containing protein n=1 Tax=Cannabis sativa TaxID=3483 RepID=A0A803NUA6_CANSA